MTIKEVKNLLQSIKSNGLIWDKLEEAEEMHEVNKIKELFKRYHSKLVYSILFEENTQDLPLYIDTKDKWLEFVVDWKLRH